MRKWHYDDRCPYYNQRSRFTLHPESVPKEKRCKWCWSLCRPETPEEEKRWIDQSNRNAQPKS